MDPTDEEVEAFASAWHVAYSEGDTDNLIRRGIKAVFVLRNRGSQFVEHTD